VRVAERGGIGYSYTVNDAPQHRTRMNQGCQLCERLEPGEPVRVFYSTRLPELSVVTLKMAGSTTLFATLLLLLLAGWLLRTRQASLQTVDMPRPEGADFSVTTCFNERMLLSDRLGARVT
jgi:hypothetical protein